ncbi:hypothetical protein CHU98_g5403 [Xylaria longipes]|nr:hypothetical protein CHU98_g5403 [Xylaria longipes]
MAKRCSLWKIAFPLKRSNRFGSTKLLTLTKLFSFAAIHITTKFFSVVLLATSVAAAAVKFDITLRDIEALIPRHHRGAGASGNGNGNQNTNGRNRGGNRGGNVGTGNDAVAGGTPADNGSATNDTVTGGNTLVLKEVGGVPGNEYLTFRNNGEIVDAACVNKAADRQLTPATVSGTSALRVQRSFSAGFRADLVGVQACLGFNSTHFRASDCADPDVELVSFTGGELRTASYDYLDVSGISVKCSTLDMGRRIGGKGYSTPGWCNGASAENWSPIPVEPMYHKGQQPHAIARLGNGPQQRRLGIPCHRWHPCGAMNGWSWLELFSPCPVCSEAAPPRSPRSPGARIADVAVALAGTAQSAAALQTPQKLPKLPERLD